MKQKDMEIGKRYLVKGSHRPRTLLKKEVDWKGQARDEVQHSGITSRSFTYVLMTRPSTDVSEAIAANRVTQEYTG